MKRLLIAFALAFILAVSTACKPEEGSPQPPGPPAAATTFMCIYEDDAVVRYAAQELSTYAGRATGNPVPGYTPAAWASLSNLGLTPEADRTVYLGTADWFTTYYPEFEMELYANSLVYDGYLMAPVEGGIAVMSNFGRGVLYGVYGLLESNGFGFYGYLEGQEAVPSLKELTLPGRITVSNPSFEVRSLEYEGTVTGYEEESDYIAMLSWAAKNGVNEVISDVYSAYVGHDLERMGFADLRARADVVDRTSPESGAICREPTTVRALGYRLSDRSAEISSDLPAFLSAGVKGIAFTVEKDLTGFLFDADLYCLVKGAWNAGADLSAAAEEVFSHKYGGTGVTFAEYTAAARAGTEELSALAGELYFRLAVVPFEGTSLKLLGDERCKMRVSVLYADYLRAAETEKEGKLAELNAYLAGVGHGN